MAFSTAWTMKIHAIARPRAQSNQAYRGAARRSIALAYQRRIGASNAAAAGRGAGSSGVARLTGLGPGLGVAWVLSVRWLC